MKAIKNTTIARIYREELRAQMNLLLDFVGETDDLDERGIIVDEILALRAKIRPLERLSYLELSKHVAIEIITLNSSINGNIHKLEFSDTFGDQPPVAIPIIQRLPTG